MALQSNLHSNVPAKIGPVAHPEEIDSFVDPYPWATGLARGCGQAVFLVGATVILGWIFDIPTLTSIVPGLSSMKFNTATCFVLCGGALWLSADATRRNAVQVRALALAAAAIACFTLMEYALGVDFGIDNTFGFDTDLSGRAIPGRMAPFTAASFAMFAAILAWPGTLSRKAQAAVTFVGLAAAIAPFFAIVGYAYGIRELYTPLPFTSMAFHTALAFLTLYVGVAAIRPETGWMALMTSTRPSGALACFLLPAVLWTPILLGFIRLEGELAGYYDGRTGLAIMATSCAFIFSAAVWIGLRRLAAQDKVLMHQQLMHEAVLNTTLDAFLIMDEAGRVLEWNPQAEKLFGWRRDEVVGRVFGELCLPESQRAAHAAEFVRYAQTGESPRLGSRLETVVLTRDGSEVPAEFFLTAIKASGRVAFAGFLRDLAERRLLEEQLRQSQKMEAIGQLTGGIAHDFNNVLTVVVGNLDALQTEVSDRLKPIVGNALKMAEHGAQLVQRLLSVSRKRNLKKEQVDLSAVVAEMEPLLRRTLGVHIDIEIRCLRPVWPVNTDRGQLCDTLLNLCINARDAMTDGRGTITIEVENVTFDRVLAERNPTMAAGDYVMLSVADTGQGMSETVMRRAFEPFFTTKPAGKGTGLGLSMVYGFVKQAGGHAQIQSKERVGTKIRLYFPADATAANREIDDAAQRQPEAGGNEWILVVEDDADVRRNTVAQLTNLGYRVKEAKDATQAEEVLDNEPSIQLLLTDVVMPGPISGLDLRAHVARNRPDVRVVICSGFPYDAETQGLADPTAIYLAKPFRRHVLAAKVREALDS